MPLLGSPSMDYFIKIIQHTTMSEGPNSVGIFKIPPPSPEKSESGIWEYSESTV